MDPFLIVLLGIGAMFVLILLHVPVGIAMMAVGVGGYAIIVGIKPALSTLVSETAGNIENPGLAVIPLFLLMGSFATAGGLSSEIYRLANAFLGHRKGGLAFATMGGCGVFGAVCGSSTATAATFGRVALPEMLKRGYAPHFAAGTIAAGGTLGALVPPSVIMIIYAVVTRENILDLFVAAVVPAVLAIVFHFGAIRIYLMRSPESAPAGEKFDWRQRWQAIKGAWAVLILLVAVIGGIYGGVVTVDEAAAMGAMLSLAFAILRRRLTWRRFLGCLDRERSGHGDDLCGHLWRIGVCLFHHGGPGAAGADDLDRRARSAAIDDRIRPVDRLRNSRRDIRHRFSNADYPAIRAAYHRSPRIRSDLVGHHQCGRCRARHDHAANRHERLCLTWASAKHSAQPDILWRDAICPFGPGKANCIDPFPDIDALSCQGMNWDNGRSRSPTLIHRPGIWLVASLNHIASRLLDPSRKYV